MTDEHEHVREGARDSAAHYDCPQCELTASRNRINTAPAIHKIVFDDMTHMLDHHIGSRYCRSTNSTARKSIRLHWQYLRQYKHTWDQRLMHHLFGCWIGRHDMGKWYRRSGESGWYCEWCSYNTPPKEKEA